MTFKSVMKSLIPRSIIRIVSAFINLRSLTKRNCPVCDYFGHFGFYGHPPRLDAECPNCGSLERHRLFWLWFTQENIPLPEPVLHFAPERILSKKLNDCFKEYKTADILDKKVNIKLNIELIDLTNMSQGTVICNHVLEHVSDSKALKEIHRILKENGILICSVPIIEGWEKTYENETILQPKERALHFGQNDHVRYYGRDFRDKLRTAGFNVAEFTAEGELGIKHSLLRGAKIFVCRKI